MAKIAVFVDLQEARVYSTFTFNSLYSQWLNDSPWKQPNLTHMPQPTDKQNTAPGAKTVVKKRFNSRVIRTNTKCKDCSKDLVKSEGETCDECRLTKLGWRKA